MKKRGFFGRVLRVLGLLSVGVALLAPLAACGPRAGGPAPLVLGASPWAGVRASRAPERQPAPLVLGASPWAGVRASPAPGRQPAPLVPPSEEGVYARHPLVVATLSPPPHAVKRVPPSPETAVRSEPAVVSAARVRPPAIKPRFRPPERLALAVPRTRPHSAPALRPPPVPQPTHPVESVEATAAPAPTALPAPAVRPASEESFQWPVRGRVIASFGPGPDGTHNEGINIAAPRGAPVEATAGGVVVYAGNKLPGYGNLVLIKHNEGWISAYAHLDVILVKRGQKVPQGQVIGRVGATGSVGTPQLHFELRRADRAVNPLKYLVPHSTAARSSGPPPG